MDNNYCWYQVHGKACIGVGMGEKFDPELDNNYYGDVFILTEYPAPSNVQVVGIHPHYLAFS